jgi:hypothetical protein
MHRGIVTGKFECDRVGMAAHDGGLALVEPPRRLGQPRLAAGDSRPLGGERHFQIALARNGAQANADRALEWFGRRVFDWGLWLNVRRHAQLSLREAPVSRQLSATLTALSGNSCPKQR